MAHDITLEYMQWKQRGMVDHGRVRFSHSAFSNNLGLKDCSHFGMGLIKAGARCRLGQWVSSGRWSIRR